MNHDEASRWVKLRSFTICSTVGTMAQRPEVHPEVRKTWETWETWETWAADASSIGRDRKDRKDRNDPGIGAATSDRFFPGPGAPQKCRLF